MEEVRFYTALWLLVLAVTRPGFTSDSVWPKWRAGTKLYHGTVKGLLLKPSLPLHHWPEHLLLSCYGLFGHGHGCWSEPSAYF